MSKRLLLGFAFALLGACLNLSASISPQKVYVAAVRGDPSSVRIAEKYVAARGIPKENIILLDCPSKGIVEKNEYFDTVETPILRALAQRGALKGEFPESGGGARSKFAFLSHDVDFLVLCRGVPWGVKSSEGKAPQTPGKISSRTDAASVDSELSAVFLPQTSLDGFVKNPAYGKIGNPDIAKISGVLRVARLDGATEKSVEKLMSSALTAERVGARGRVYIDKCKMEANADKWLDVCADVFSKMGFDVSSDSQKELFGFDSRMDGCLFYFGWYSTIPAGYFSLSDFKTATGATGLHIFSFSARDMRRDWTPALVERGCAATFGNVFEPYLGMTHHPHIVAVSLASGLPAGEAAYAAIPVLSWQGVFVGDPLYSPFKRGLEEQINDISKGVVDDLSQYAVIRAMNVMSNKGLSADAEKFGRGYVGKIPDVALVEKLAETARARGDNAESMRLKESLAARRELVEKCEYRGLAMQIASDISAENPKAAMSVYSALAAQKIPVSFQKTLVAKARSLAEKSGEPLGGALEKLAAAQEKK